MKKIRLRDEQKGFIFLAIIVVIIIAVSIIMAKSLKKDDVAEKLADDQVVRVLTVLDDGNGNAVFTNVLIYYPVSRKALTINVPGNTAAIYKSLDRVDRIDQVYKEKGIEVYKSEIEKLLDCTIPFFITMDFPNFVKITDMFGGMRIFIPSPIDVLSEDGERYLLPSGAVILDGDKISTYLKYKMEDETYSDMQERCQNVVDAFYTMLHEKRNVIIAKKKNYRYIEKLFKFNLDSDDSRRLLMMIGNIDSESIVRQNITGRVRIVDEKKLLFPLNNGEFIKEAIKQSTNMLVSNNGTYASRVYVLEIKNGTTIQGLAHNTSILFQNASYDVLSAVNADRNDYEKTVIIDHIGNKEIASMVGNFIHCTNIQEEEVDVSKLEPDTSADVDFTIILGKDFDGRYVR